MEKIYRVEFMEYTNVTENVVRNNDLYAPGDDQYMDVGKKPCLIPESAIPKFMNYGGGYLHYTLPSELSERGRE